MLPSVRRKIYLENSRDVSEAGKTRRVIAYPRARAEFVILFTRQIFLVQIRIRFAGGRATEGEGGGGRGGRPPSGGKLQIQSFTATFTPSRQEASHFLIRKDS